MTSPGHNELTATVMVDNPWCCVLKTCLTQWGRDKMDAISQTTFFKCIFLNENVWISIKISLKFVPKGPINNVPTLVQIMAWCRPGDKPLSEPMMVNLPTHICVPRPQWVKNSQTPYTVLYSIWKVLSINFCQMSNTFCKCYWWICVNKWQEYVKKYICNQTKSKLYKIVTYTTFIFQLCLWHH